MIKLISWNVNGLRAVEKKGFHDFIDQEQPDILCLQEIKAFAGQLPPTLREKPGYELYINSAERPGYSGTAVYTRLSPLSVTNGFGDPVFDREGRTQILDFGTFVLYNIYYPNGTANGDRLQYKLDFYEVFHAHAQAQIARGRSVVVCGDFNTAHQEIDLARPKENAAVSGFLPEERAFLDRLVASGFIDTFRLFETGSGHYSWWDLKSRARDRNVGWRLDYFFVSEQLKGQVEQAYLLPGQMGSDHCPVVLVLRVPQP